MNITESKAANALGGKTARACDSCLIKRARWFCTADDAFLCQACDASVHSANQLASRHERVRLETSSFKGHDVINNSSSTPAWHHGFTRKARTPRHAKSARLQPAKDNHQPLALVPEINGDEPFGEEINEEEQLLYRVPVFDPFGDEFRITHEMVKGEEREEAVDDDVDLNLEELLLSTCDVENLLGNGDGEGSSACRIDDIDLGLAERVDCGDEGQNLNDHEVSLGGKRVKVEEEDDDDDEVQAVIACHFDPALDMELNWEFDYASSMSNGEADEMKKEDVGVELGTVNNVDVTIMSRSGEESQVDISNNKKNNMLQLRLNYEAVIAAWETQGSPWTNGIRPHEFNVDEFMDACSGGNSHTYGGFGERLGANDAGREARVSRYREKRRTRLFSKKIRYQVRKLNAEKRPRMKGRFVKRTNFSGPYLPYMINK